MHKNYIDKIIQSSDNRKMQDLEQVLLNTISYIEEVDPKTYDKIECDLYEIAEGKKLDKDKAEKWVNKMKPSAAWTYEEIENIKSKFSTDIPITALYIIMNMLFSDFGDILGEEMTDEVINRYIRAAEDWYYDSDLIYTEDEKLYFYWKYFTEKN